MLCKTTLFQILGCEYLFSLCSRAESRQNSRLRMNAGTTNEPNKSTDKNIHHFLSRKLWLADKIKDDFFHRKSQQLVK